MPASSLTLVRDAGIEPASSRLKGECISLSANPANSGGRRWNRTSLVSIKSRVHLPSLPVTHVQHQNWCRMLELNQRLAVIDRGLDLRANPAWCAVRELNPHLLGVGQRFWSVELPARKIGRGCRSRTCLAALIWRRSGYKPLPLAGGPSIGGSRWIRTTRDGFMRAAFFLLN
jgi:hypothetical protein